MNKLGLCAAAAAACASVAAGFTVFPIVGNVTDDGSVNAWREYAGTTYPMAESVLSYMWQHYLLTVAVVLGALVVRWNYSPAVLNGGWHGEGRPMIPKRINKEMLPPYPNGWYRILPEEDLPPETVKSISLCGRKLVAFKSKTGKVGVLDAYCPHLGADLGVHGVVVEDCVKCPFHGWRFNPDGECAGIDYSECIPKGSSIKAYPVYRAMLGIFVWYDAEDREPWYFPRHHEEIESGKWYKAAWSGHEVLTHIQEVPENGADVAHLDVLHKAWVFWGDLHKQPNKLPVEDKPVLKHKWHAEWKVNEDAPWSTSMKVRMDIFAFDTWHLAPSLFAVPVTASQHGPALVYLNLHTPFGDMMMFQNIVPVGKMRQRVEHTYFASPSVPRWIAKIVAYGASRQFERDVPIWEAKTFTPKPILTKGDGPIPRFRAWYKTHYSENSVKFDDEDDTTW